MNWILCGMMGAGKTTVGVRIAQKTGRRWYDTDGMIVDRHGKISAIFEYYGEEYFRKLETQIVKELAGQDGLILSTGGGLVLQAENDKLLKENGKIVFLRAKAETLFERLKLDDVRPLLHGSAENLKVRLQELLLERGAVYESVADFVVDVEGKTIDDVADEIIALIVKNEKTDGAGTR